MQRNNTRHEPDTAFAARLEATLVSELRRREREAPVSWWAGWMPAHSVAALALIVITSMAIGGGAVAAAYEAENRQAKNELLEMYQRRLDVATQRRQLAETRFKETEIRSDVGLVSEDAEWEAAAALAEASAAESRLSVDIDEVRATGREPRQELSAPKVGSRDFVSERLAAERRAAAAALQLKQRLAQKWLARAEIGVIGPEAAVDAQLEVTLATAALEAVDRRIAIRAAFLAGRQSGVVTDLRGMEVAAEQMVKGLRPKVVQARKDVERLEQRAKVGVVAAVDVAEARVKQLELETELSKAELDLALVQRRLRERIESEGV